MSWLALRANSPSPKLRKHVEGLCIGGNWFVFVGAELELLVNVEELAPLGTNSGAFLFQ
jgi:hypothetical protein